MREWLTWVLLGVSLGLLALWLKARDQRQNDGWNTVHAVATVRDSVVSIRTRKITPLRPNLPNDPALQRFFGATPAVPERESVQGSVGSAVVLNAQGYLLTNHHVVSGFDEIWISGSDGRTAAAILVGSDPDTDLAVLKAEMTGLAAIKLAKPESLEVGAPVLAVGNPLGIGQSVSLGVISALDRTLNAGAPFIQTDAAINSGSSGGALINLKGELIGINALVLNRRLGEGIGFAIPAELAQDVARQLIEQGFVTRGWLGLNYGDSTAVDARAGREVIVVRVLGFYVGAPGQLSGIQPGDLLLELDGKAITRAEQLARLEASTKPGSEVTLTGLRAGIPFSARIKLIQRPEVETP